MNSCKNLIVSMLVIGLIAFSAVFTPVSVQGVDISEDTSVKLTADSATPYNATTDGVTLTLEADGATNRVLSGGLTGNMNVDVKFTSTANNNGCRLTLTGANTFTGGLTVTNGTLQGGNANFGSASSMTLNGGTLMVNADNVTVAQEITLNGSGGLRPSKAFRVSGKITGNGDLLFVCDGNGERAVTLLNTESDYNGLTNIGGFNPAGAANSAVGVILGASEVLSNGSVVQIGKTYGAVNTNTVLTSSYLNLNGQTETIAGLEGVGKLQNNGVTEATKVDATLNIVTATDANHSFTGSISGSKAIALNVSGAGTQAIGGTFTLKSLSIDGATFSLMENANATVSGTVATSNGGTLALGTGSSLKANAVTGLTGVLDLDGSNLSVVQNVAGVTEITNSNTDTLSTFTFRGGATGVTMPKMTGNLRFLLDMSENENNASRVAFSGGTSLGGGLEIKSGTVTCSSLAIFDTLPQDANGKRQIDMNGGSLMYHNDSLSDAYVLNMMAGGGGYRQGSKAGTLAARITGVGHFEVVNDWEVTITNQGNDYQGWTYLGKTAYRNLTDPTSVVIGNNEVLPDTTVLQIGGGKVTGMSTVRLNGKTETIAGLTGGRTGATVNGFLSGDGVLKINDTQDLAYFGKIEGGMNIDKAGSATWTVGGALNMTGSMIVSGGKLNLNGTGTVAKVDVKAGATYNHDFNGTVSSIDLNGGDLYFAYDKSGTLNINAQSGDSVVHLNGSTYLLQEKFESPNNASVDQNYAYSGPLTENANQVTSMDPWVNTQSALLNQTSADVWGDASTDKSVTNVFQMKLINTNDTPVSIDLGKYFHNDAMISLMDGATEIALVDWANKTAVTSQSKGEQLNIELEPGKEYTLEVRASRYNRTIGPGRETVNGVPDTWLGLNRDTNDLIGIGIRPSNTETWYRMNFGNSGEFGWEGSGIYSMLLRDGEFAPQSFAIAEGATVTLQMVPNSKNVLSTPVTGAGTLRLASSGNYLSQIALSAGVEGNVIVEENVTMQTQGNARITIGGVLTLADESSIFLINNQSAPLSALNMTGIGRIVVDLDSFGEAGIADAMITLADVENVDLSDLSIVFEGSEGSEDDWSAYAGRQYQIFNDELLERIYAIAATPGWKVNPVTGAFMVDGGDPSAVPEPATWALLLLALAGLGIMRKR